MSLPLLSMITNAFEMKDPAENYEHSFNFSELMAQFPGDTIQAATFTADSSDITIATITVSVGNYVTAIVGGGTTGITYILAAKITTVAGRIFKRSANLPVGPRS